MNSRVEQDCSRLGAASCFVASFLLALVVVFSQLFVTEVVNLLTVTRLLTFVTGKFFCRHSRRYEMIRPVF